MSVLRPSRSAKIGVAVAAVCMLALQFAVSGLVIRWCPRGENCKEASQVLFALGLLVSLGVAIAAGFVARDVADRFSTQPPR